MDKFEIGEVAVYVAAFHPDDSSDAKLYDGQDIEIIGSPYATDEYGLRYPCRFSDGGGFQVVEADLRKKKPPHISKDIEETRQRGAPKWSVKQYKQDCKRELEKEHV